MTRKYVIHHQRYDIFREKCVDINLFKIRLLIEGELVQKNELLLGQAVFVSSSSKGGRASKSLSFLRRAVKIGVKIFYRKLPRLHTYLSKKISFIHEFRIHPSAIVTQRSTMKRACLIHNTKKTDIKEKLFDVIKLISYI